MNRLHLLTTCFTVSAALSWTTSTAADGLPDSPPEPDTESRASLALARERLIGKWLIDEEHICDSPTESRSIPDSGRMMTFRQDDEQLLVRFSGGLLSQEANVTLGIQSEADDPLLTITISDIRSSDDGTEPVSLSTLRGVFRFKIKNENAQQPTALLMNLSTDEPDNPASFPRSLSEKAAGRRLLSLTPIQSESLRTPAEDAASGNEPKLRAFTLDHRQATEIADLLKPFMLDPSFHAVADDAGKTLFVWGRPNSMRAVHRLIETLDLKPHQREDSDVPPDRSSEDINRLRADYEEAERAAHRLAAQLNQASDSTLKDSLQEAVTQVFQLRQRLLRAELSEMQNRLRQTKRLLDKREQTIDQIVTGRVNELLNPQWNRGLSGEVNRTLPGEPDPAANSNVSDPVNEARQSHDGPSAPAVGHGEFEPPGLRILGDPRTDEMVAVTFQPSPHSTLERLKTDQKVFISQTLRPKRPGYSYTPIIAGDCILKEFWANRQRAASNQPVVILVPRRSLWELVHAEKRGALEVHAHNPASTRRNQPKWPAEDPVMPPGIDVLSNAVVRIAVKRVVKGFDIGDLLVGTGVVVSEDGLILAHFDDETYLDHKDVEARLQDQSRIPLVVAEKSPSGLLLLRPRDARPKLESAFALNPATPGNGDVVYLFEHNPTTGSKAVATTSKIMRIDGSEGFDEWQIARPEHSERHVCDAIIARNGSLIGIPMRGGDPKSATYRAIPVAQLSRLFSESVRIRNLDIASGEQRLRLEMSDETTSTWQEQLQGQWNVRQISEDNGSEDSVTLQAVIQGNRIHFGKSDDAGPASFDFQLGAPGPPQEIDLHPVLSPDDIAEIRNANADVNPGDPPLLSETPVFPGIVDFDGDAVRFCLHLTPAEAAHRPTQFAIGPTTCIWELRRAESRPASD